MEKLLRDKKAIIIFVSPALILFTIVLFIPICQSIYFSLCDIGVGTRTFVGFKNYIKLFTNDEHMLIALKNSMFFMAFSVLTQLVLGMLLAALLSNLKLGKNFFKNVYYLPCVLSSAALGLMWMFIFNQKFGINKILAQWGIKGPAWLQSNKGFIILPMWVIAFVALWQYVGQSMMLYMAQISGIDKSLYEASYIDGASKVQSFFNVTIPLIKPMVATAVSLNCIGSLKFFDLIYTMETPDANPGHKTEVLATHLYTQGFRFTKYGYASAIGVVLLILCLVVTVVINKFVKVSEDDMAGGPREDENEEA